MTDAANGDTAQTGLAFSTTLPQWMGFPANPVIRNREGGFDAQFASDPKVFRDDGHWTMFYFGEKSITRGVPQPCRFERFSIYKPSALPSGR